MRFRRFPEDWPLPGGVRVDWLAASTFDRRVGLSAFTPQVTRKIAANIDRERDHLVSSIAAVSPDIKVEVLEDFSTAFHARNGGGDAIATDRHLPIITLGGLASSASSTVAPSPESAIAEAEKSVPCPPSAYLALVLIIWYLGVPVARLIFAWIDVGPSNDVWDSLLGATAPLEHWVNSWVHSALLAGDVVTIVVQIVFAWGIWSGVQGGHASC